LGGEGPARNVACERAHALCYTTRARPWLSAALAYAFNRGSGVREEGNEWNYEKMSRGDNFTTKGRPTYMDYPISPNGMHWR
jgi:hypothetical protein